MALAGETVGRVATRSVRCHCVEVALEEITFSRLKRVYSAVFPPFWWCIEATRAAEDAVARANMVQHLLECWHSLNN